MLFRSAGDGFTAAFAHAVLSGYALPDAVRYANVAGALVATGIGAQGSVITDADILERLGGGQSAAKAPAKKPKTAKLEPLTLESKPPERKPLEPVAAEALLEPAAPVKRSRKKA